MALLVPRPPTRSAAGNIDARSAMFHRPTSAPTVKFDVKRHHALLQQLRSALATASNETPPAGTDLSELAQRIQLLKKMIADTERMGIEARIQADAEHKKRYCSAERAKLRHEEVRHKKIVESEQQHDKNFVALQEDTALLHRHMQKILRIRTEKCHDVVEETLRSKEEKAESQRRRREEHLALLEQRRQKEVAAHAEVVSSRERHAAEVLSKKMEQEQMHYEAQMKQYDAHRQEAEQRRKRLDEERARSSSARLQHETKARERGHVARVSVVLQPGGAAVLDVAEKPFEARLAEAAELERRREQRYEQEHRVRREFARFRAARSNDRHKAQEERYETISRQRLQRGELLLSQLQQRCATADGVSARRRRMADALLQRKELDVQEHLHRAALLEEKRINDIRQKRFLRWSGQTDTATEHLLEEYKALASDAMLRQKQCDAYRDSGEATPPLDACDDEFSTHIVEGHAATSSSLRRESYSQNKQRGASPHMELTDRGSATALSATLNSGRRHETMTMALSSR